MIHGQEPRRTCYFSLINVPHNNTQIKIGGKKHWWLEQSFSIISIIFNHFQSFRKQNRKFRKTTFEKDTPNVAKDHTETQSKRLLLIKNFERNSDLKGVKNI